MLAHPFQVRAAATASVRGNGQQRRQAPCMFFERFDSKELDGPRFGTGASVTHGFAIGGLV
jgi:hypothetical protein